MQEEGIYRQVPSSWNTVDSMVKRATKAAAGDNCGSS